MEEHEPQADQHPQWHSEKNLASFFSSQKLSPHNLILKTTQLNQLTLFLG